MAKAFACSRVNSLSRGGRACSSDAGGALLIGVISQFCRAFIAGGLFTMVLMGEGPMFEQGALQKSNPSLVLGSQVMEAGQ